MQREDRELALAWRLSTREIFEAYLPRYQVTGFARTEDGGKYLLEVR
jgi:predicted GNAT superfamily acetyltransferase